MEVSPLKVFKELPDSFKAIFVLITNLENKSSLHFSNFPFNDILSSFCSFPFLPFPLFLFQNGFFFFNSSLNILFARGAALLFRKYEPVSIPQLQSYYCLEASTETDTEPQSV